MMEKIKNQKKDINLLLQIAIVFGICLIGEGIKLLLPFPFPGSVISMILLFLLLLLRIVRVHHVQVKANFLLKNMAFFFIPAGVAIMDKYEFIKDNVVALLLVCFITTVLTFAATAFTVKGVIVLQDKLRSRGSCCVSHNRHNYDSRKEQVFAERNGYRHE